MKNHEYERLNIEIVDERDVPRGEDILYHCLKCDGIVPSQPDDSMGCTCGNVFIDTDYVRLCVDDFAQFEVVRAT